MIHLVNICAENYPEILSGGILPTAVMFPNSSMALVEGVYKQDESRSRMVAEAVGLYVSEALGDFAGGKKLKMLEVGAGTGGSSGHILDAVKDYEENIHYEYTDISRAFLIQSREKRNSEKIMIASGSVFWILKRIL